jgi:biotin carboxyl carrier protein
MKLLVRIDDEDRRVDIVERNGHYVLTIDGRSVEVDCRKAGHRHYLSLIINNKSHLVESAPTRFEEGIYYANIHGRRYEVEVLDERLVATRQARAAVKDTGPYVVVSPMPGLVVDVRVKVGDTVKAGSPVVIMEAMKMRNELVTEIDGVVKNVTVKPQDSVDTQTPLVEIERHP